MTSAVRRLFAEPPPIPGLPGTPVATAVAVGAGACAVAIVTFALTSFDRGLTYALVLAQTFGVVWLVLLGHARRDHWVSATFVTGAAWAPLFLAPCWIYAIDPSRLEASKNPGQAIALVDISLFAMIAGLLAVRGRYGAPSPPDRVRIDAAEPSGRALIGFGVFGLACLAVLLARNGGPLAYVSNQYRSSDLNSGLLYVVWGVLFLRFAPLVAVASRWARGLPATRRHLAYLVLGCSIPAIMGARSFIAIGAIQVLLVAALLRRRPSLRAIAVPGVVVGILLVFGLGAVKFFQAYNAAHPNHRRTLADYLIHVAPGQALDSFENTYVPGVSLIAVARKIVPAQAGYEYGKAALQLAVTPIPRPFRPTIEEAPVVRAAFHPPGGYVYAIPLQATAYLQFGIAGVVLAFLGVGALLAAIDRALARPKQRSIGSLLALITLAIQIPVVLRGGVPGVVFLLLDVLGVWVAAIFVAGGTGGVRVRLTRELPRWRRPRRRGTASG